MSNKKPYSRNSKTVKNNRTVSNKNKNLNKDSKNVVNKNNNIKKNTNNKNKTVKVDTSPKVRLDAERINDTETLDTSFLEGRISDSNKKNIKENILKEKKDFDYKVFKNLLYIVVLLILIIVVIFVFNKIDVDNTKSNNNVVKEEEIKIELDNNYIFVGSFNTCKLDFKDDYHYVKVCDDKYNSNDILDDMNKFIYRYNPSHVFIELGINELKSDSNDDFINNMGKIIDGIKENRPYAKIYIESIYPINKDADNYDDTYLDDFIDMDLIAKTNNELKKLCNEKDVKFIDLFETLYDGNKLNEKFSDNGIILNDNGLNIVYNEIDKYVK